MSNHQFVFSLRKSRVKIGGVCNFLNFASLKNYTTDYCKEDLKQLDFPNYKCDNMNYICWCEWGLCEFFSENKANIEKVPASNFNAIRESDTLTYDTWSIFKVFKNFFSRQGRLCVSKLSFLLPFYVTDLSICVPFCLPTFLSVCMSATTSN